MIKPTTGEDAVARRKKPEAEEFTEEDMLVRLTPNQIVAYNLAQARMWKNWTQDEAAEHLAPFLGAKWSKASFSAAERSVDGQRIRQFSADEIVAFSRGFGLPVGFFFLPPPRGAAPMPIRLAAPDNPMWGIPPAELIDVVFGALGELAFMGMRVEEFFRQESIELQTVAQRRLTMHTEVVVDAIVKRDLDRFGAWRAMLTTLANQLEDWQIRASRAASGEEVPDE
ncbi:MAG: hypothetical protein ACRDZ2_10670 [Ilumatobacteraceae bacterium]